MFDVWTVPHIATGYFAAKTGLPVGIYIMLAIGFEVLEHSMEAPSGHPLFGTKHPESVKNVAGDLIAGAIEYWAGQS